jgi:hypothetical protein
MRVRHLTPFVLALALLLVVGCGQGNRHRDPFVGPWRYADSDALIVISKSAGVYNVATVRNGSVLQQIRLARHGNELKGTFKVLLDGKPTGRTITELVDFDPAKGRLTYVDGGFRLQLSKAGSSTAIPSPSSTAQ